MFSNFIEIIHNILLYSLGFMGLIGGYQVLKNKYQNTADKAMFWLKIILVVLGLISPLIVLLLTEP
ncbi:hypothetical protein BX659_12527 [Orenia metallireducens]|uniref:Uncharacterized protein n=1 Tax=Orenia metallireducens TaxID=1413210 RepID=A0A285HT59_9FIRM|nr:hypothetical protein [Orenia metallireducens]PRX24064.1 hypothetical protein BX659_12527 [Orenia metallireducens]SNY38813.1 hypothetical protein SAMN06265827_12428 [Orenia metallireducens]